MKRVDRTVVVACAVVAAACQAVIGADFDDVKTVDCKLAGPPPRPPPSVTDAGATSAEILAAITSVEVGDTQPSYRTVGFDQDGVCTGQGHRPSCRPFAWSGADPTDGVGGIDNSGGALLHAEQDVFGLDAFQSTKLNREIHDGKVAPLAIVRIRGWNDRSVDDAIEVDWYVAQPFGKDPAPVFDGKKEEAWPIWENTFAEGAALPVPGAPYPNSRFRAEAAYVNNYVAVARFPSGTLVNLNNVAFATEGLVLAFTLAYGPPRIVGGVIAGRVRQAEMFGKLPQMTQAFEFATAICKGDVAFPQVKRYFCQFMDSHADGRNDPNADCDAISLGMTILEATPVAPGPLAPAPQYKSCAAEVDPATDSCAIPAVVP